MVGIFDSRLRWRVGPQPVRAGWCMIESHCFHIDVHSTVKHESVCTSKVVSLQNPENCVRWRLEQDGAAYPCNEDQQHDACEVQQTSCRHARQ